MSVWDIEDLVDLGTRSHSCPYFAARQLAELSSTELVLCPYNYLIDPVICRSMGFNLDGAVILIDESHNIEDVARSSASREIDFHHIRHTEVELTRMLATFADEDGERAKHFQAARKVISSIITWMSETIPTIPTPKDRSNSEDEAEQVMSV